MLEEERRVQCFNFINGFRYRLTGSTRTSHTLQLGIAIKGYESIMTDIRHVMLTSYRALHYYRPSSTLP